MRKSFAFDGSNRVAKRVHEEPALGNSVVQLNAVSLFVTALTLNAASFSM